MKLASLLLLILGGAVAASAAPVVDTVDWAPDGSPDGAGTGTLGGIVVTYSSIVGAGNSGLTIAFNWGVIAGTNDAYGAGVTHNTGGALGKMVGTQTQTISFSGTIVDPILYTSYDDADTQMDFGAQTFSVIDSNNAQFAGNVVSFLGASNSANDSFAIKLNGTFDAAHPLVFDYTATDDTFNSFGFTIGANPVPEPASLAALGFGAALALVRRRRIGR